MRRNTATAIVSASVVAAAGGVTGLVIWLSQPSYDDIVEDCITAVKDRPKGDTGKPDACKDVKSDDYSTIIVGQVIDDEGWVDEDGNVDMGELLEDGSK